MTVHPLVPARAQQEASDLNSQLGQIVYNAIIDRLKVVGRVHADDLEAYFPPEHLLRCRKLIGGQFGSLSGRKYIEGVEYLKSSVPARKGAKSWVYVFTAKGREKLLGIVGVEGKGNEGPAPLDPGEDKAPVVHQQTTGAGVASLRAPDQSSEPLSLFDQVAA